jgi:hypothetical protein
LVPCSTHIKLAKIAFASPSKRLKKKKKAPHPTSHFD